MALRRALGHWRASSRLPRSLLSAAARHQHATGVSTQPRPQGTSASPETKEHQHHESPPVQPEAPELLFDVLGSGGLSTVSTAQHVRSEGPSAALPHNAASNDAHVSVRPHGREEDEKGSGKAQWNRRIRRMVREAVFTPLRDGRTAEESGTQNASAALPASASPYKVLVVDALGMPADLPSDAPRSFEDLLELSPAILKEQLQKFMSRNSFRRLTPVQAAAIPLMLEYRDLLCIAPTATGKTLCYVYASMLRLLLNDLHRRPAARSADNGNPIETSVGLNRRQVETFLQDKIDSGEVCPYCELNAKDTKVCPMTGLPHSSSSDSDPNLSFLSKERRVMRLEELRSAVAEPRVLVLVPNSQLAYQVYSVFRALHCDYRIHYMVRASNPEEQRKYLRALEEGVDVLVCAPETMLPALYKHKLSLKRVETLIMDEVDDVVSMNHFEPMKIILGALPKGALRPQRLLLGASLPPVAYEMIKSQMLLPSHRFILVDLKAPPYSPEAAAATPAAANGFLTARGNLRHLIFMLGRAEKIQKLVWLYHTGKLSADQRTLIFCNTRHNVAYVHDKMKELLPEVHVTTLTSHASVTAREGVLKMFRTGISTCLICSDLLSRGIDFQKVVYVVHFDMPTDMETWMHRCGRCGRGDHLNGQGYVYTFFQPENVKLAKPLVAHLRQQRQLIPPKLQEYAKQSFIDVFNNSLFHHPTRPYRRDDPQHAASALGRGTRRFPDYKQGAIHKHFRPQ